MKGRFSRFTRCLTVGRKLALIYLLDLIAVIFVSTTLIHEKYIAIDFAEKELVGNQYIAVVRDTLFSIGPEMKASEASTFASTAQQKEMASAIRTAEAAYGAGLKCEELSRQLSQVLEYPSSNAENASTSEGTHPAFSTGRELLTRIGLNGYRRTLLMDSPEADGGNLLYALELFHYDGPFTHPDDYRKYNGVLRYSQGSEANGFNITGMAYRAKWNATDQIPLRAVTSGQIGRFGAIDTTDGGDSHRYSLSGSLRRTTSAGKTAAIAYVVRNELDLYSNFTYFDIDRSTVSS